MKNCARRFGLLRAVLGWLLAAAVLLGRVSAAGAAPLPQAANDKQVSAAALLDGAQTLSARDFERRFDLALLQIVRNHKSLAPAQNALLLRLRVGKETTDASIISVVESRAFYEERQFAPHQADLGANAKTSPFLAFVDAVLANLYGRPTAQARLHSIKASFFRAQGDKKSEASENRSVIELLTPLYLETDSQRLSSTAALASILEANGDNTEAINLYEKVLSYAWYSVVFADVKPEVQARYLDTFRSLYIEAGKGLIRLHAGDLKALQNLVFFPAAMDELGPLLRTAISRAQFKQKQDEAAAPQPGAQPAPPAPK